MVKSRLLEKLKNKRAKIKRKGHLHSNNVSRCLLYTTIASRIGAMSYLFVHIVVLAEQLRFHSRQLEQFKQMAEYKIAIIKHFNRWQNRN